MMKGPPGRWSDEEEMDELYAEISRQNVEIARLRVKLAEYETERTMAENIAGSLYDDPPANIHRSPVSWWRSG